MQFPLSKLPSTNAVQPVCDALVERIATQLLTRHATLVTAESCTAGGIASALCRYPGASHWFKGSIVAYTEAVKSALLCVPAEQIERNGVVSASVAEAMAIGALRQFSADYALASTGAAGPSSPDDDTKVGTVWLAFASKKGVRTECLNLKGSRNSITQTAVQAALTLCIRSLYHETNPLSTYLL